MNKKIVLLGAGALGLNVAQILRRMGDFDLVGFVDAKDGTVAGIPILGGDEILDDLLGRGIDHAFPSIGNSSRRVALSRELRSRGFTIPTLVHPGADVGIGTELGAGAAIFHGAFCGPESVVGDHSLLEAGVFVGHHVTIGEGVLVAATAKIGNGATLGAYCTVGYGARVRNGADLPPQSRLDDYADYGPGAP